MTDPIEIIRVNLNALEEELISLGERKCAHLNERFGAILSEAGAPAAGEFAGYMDVVREIDREYFPQQSFNSERCIPENSGAVRDLSEQSRVSERMFLCRMLSARYGDALRLNAFFRDSGGMAASNRISYHRSAFSDLAYRRFSEVLAEPTSVYGKDFASTCEDVYDGRAGLCILPIEHSVEGRMSSFHHLISKYDLKVVLTCPVSLQEGGASTRFALLRRSVQRIRIPESCPHRELFSFSLTLPGEGDDDKLADLSDILFAARSAGLELMKIDSDPLTDAEGEYNYELTFYTDAPGADLRAFLLYLLLDAPQFTPIGLYSHLL